MKPTGNPVVQAWLDQQVAESLFLTTISLSELLVGIEILPESKRKQGLSHALRELLHHLFGSRILSFDEKAAIAYASMFRRARTLGKAISMADGQIAAITKVHGFTVATRDTSPFEAAGIPVIDPWKT
ncbi:type II toxin-antitoxin system VapC family toxin [Sulfidibacter corallicola]|uniref:Type II toxin-antitoxin system VapC family toxin n=2 Tax=Sulfidibacter corallicola TaxID=2818388 RepID=A0A8A4TYG3_SULCO|nr:type II toxin-antitoxin system VapC family toxin [Sulfidibacter corallicola]